MTWKIIHKEQKLKRSNNRALRDTQLNDKLLNQLYPLLAEIEVMIDLRNFDGKNSFIFCR